MLVRLVTGCSWEDAERLTGGVVSDTTARERRDEWIEAGVFGAIAFEAINGYDKIIGLDLSEVAVDGSLHKSPCGGEGTGKNPTDRAKLGWKWSIATDANGIPIGWTADGANRNDSVLLAPTLDDVAGRGLLAEIETLWLDRGYDSDVTRSRLAERGIVDAVIARKSKRKRGALATTKNLPMGLRWPVERTNSWLSNYGQMRRNTDRKVIHRLRSARSCRGVLAHGEAHRLAEPLVKGPGAYPLTFLGAGATVSPRYRNFTMGSSALGGGN